MEFKLHNENEFRGADYHLRNGSEVVINQLSPSSIYDIKIVSENNTCIERIATKSNSTGIIKNYFNHAVLAGDANDLQADGTEFSDVEKALKDLIKSAKSTIDYCAYNTSVTSIVNALIDASARGVKVRVIAESVNDNTALQSSLPFNVLYDDNDKLMHNKFIIVDVTSEDNAHVVMGSMNFTTNQMKVDPNHLMFIQDKSLAQAYTIEFEEMWGSTTSVPNGVLSKFGEEKEDNTPHIFDINGKRVESYFSPSDRTASKIRSKLATANEKINCGLFLITHDLLIEELKYQGNIGIEVKVLLDDDSDGILGELRSKNVIAFKDQSSTIFHYKTGIVDGQNAMSNPILITGSHNWTYSADTWNDENTIIIHDAALANLYDRALDYWWDFWNLSPAYDIIKNDEMVMNTFGNVVFGESINSTSIDKISCFNSIGQMISAPTTNINSSFSIDLTNQASGIYFIQFRLQNKMLTKPFIKL